MHLRAARPRATIVAIALAMVTGGCSDEPEPEPVQLVREFFAAVVERDPQRAIAIAGVANPPAGEEARFLDPAAMSDQWEVRDIGPASPVGDEDRLATIVVTIAGQDGATAQANVSTVSTELGEDGKWVIREPFARVAFGPTPLWYLDVNGLRTPSDADAIDQQYLLLPGFYRFYPQLPAGIEAQFEDQLLLPGSAAAVNPTRLTSTETGHTAIRKAYEDHVDTCAESTEMLPPGCPFGATYYSELDGASVTWSTSREVQWTVREYPEITVSPGTSSFRLAASRPGVVELRATVETVREGAPGGSPAARRPEEGSELAVECEFGVGDLDFEGLGAGSTSTSEVAIAIEPPFVRERFIVYPDPPQPGDPGHVTRGCVDATMAENQ